MQRATNVAAAVDNDGATSVIADAATMKVLEKKMFQTLFF